MQLYTGTHNSEIINTNYKKMNKVNNIHKYWMIPNKVLLKH